MHSILSEPARTVYEAWDVRAPELARWGPARLVNRGNAHGAYRSHADRGKCYTKADGTEGVLGAVYTSKVALTERIFLQHFRATGPEHVIGAHSTSATNTSKWGGIDIDQHGETSAPP